MYRVLGRERLGRRRLGRYCVHFSIPWPRGVRRLYLVSSFTSMFPGRVELERRSDRGFAEVLLWEGGYPYIYVTEHYEPVPDYENHETCGTRIFGEEASLARVGVEELEEALGGGGLHEEHIIHDERNPGFAHRYLGLTVLRLWTLRGEVDEVQVEALVGGRLRTVEARRVHRDRYRDYYEAKVTGSVHAYRFLLRIDGKNISYGPDGVGDEGFFTPKIGGLDREEWWLGATYYLVFPDSFDRHPEGFPEDAWRRVRERRHLGGNLEGIRRRLSYLEELGVDAVYLTPIYKAPSYHRYDVVDHRSVDPLLGNLEDFDRLVSEAHARGIRVVLDLVAHHTSPCAPMFREAISAGKRSMYWSMYRFLVDDPGQVPKSILDGLHKFIEEGCTILSKELAGQRPFYESFAAGWHMPKLNHPDPEAWRYLEETVRFWLSRGIDGFRVDVAHALPEETLEKLYHEVKSFGTGKVLIMEINSGIDTYPLGRVADSAMNYDLRDWVIGFFLEGSLTAQELAERVMTQYVRLPTHVANALYNLLGSHDTPRIKTLAQDCKPCLHSAYAFLFTIHGSPSIYYGDEVGMEGGSDPDCRRPMIWRRELWDKELLDLVRSLAWLRRRHRVLRLGYSRVYALGRDALAVRRTLDGEEVLALFNRSHQRVDVIVGRGYVDAFTGTPAEPRVELCRGFRILYKA